VPIRHDLSVEPDALADELRAHGIVCRVRTGGRGTEIVLETCIFCMNKKWNLQINSSLGAYYCWACTSGGRAGTILSSLLGREIRIVGGQRPLERKQVLAPIPDVVPVSRNPAALAYLASRRMSAAVAAQYDLGVCMNPTHVWAGRLVVPLRNWDGAVVGHVARSFTGGSPKYLAAVPSDVPVGWRASDRAAPHVIVEGAFDGIAVHQAGCHAVLLLGTGGSGQALVEWIGRLTLQDGPPPDVVLCLDGDAAARSELLWWRLSALMIPVRRVALPPHLDPADLRPEVLHRLLQRDQVYGAA
jgi:DNA primase